MDMTLKGIPDGITKEQICEWVGVFVERFYNQKLAPPVAEVEKAKTDIDAYRKANALTAKFEPVAEPVEPKA